VVKPITKTLKNSVGSWTRLTPSQSRIRKTKNSPMIDVMLGRGRFRRAARADGGSLRSWTEIG
jgi:hypothetical protein